MARHIIILPSWGEQNMMLWFLKHPAFESRLLLHTHIFWTLNDGQVWIYYCLRPILLCCKLRFRHEEKKVNFLVMEVGKHERGCETWAFVSGSVIDFINNIQLYSRPPLDLFWRAGNMCSIEIHIRNFDCFCVVLHVFVLSFFCLFWFRC